MDGIRRGKRKRKKQKQIQHIVESNTRFACAIDGAVKEKKSRSVYILLSAGLSPVHSFLCAAWGSLRSLEVFFPLYFPFVSMFKTYFFSGLWGGSWRAGMDWRRRGIGWDLIISI